MKPAEYTPEQYAAAALVIQHDGKLTDEGRKVAVSGLRLVSSPAPETADALAICKTAIEGMIKNVESAPEGAFGYDSDGDPDVPGGARTWPRKDDFLHHLRDDLAKINAIVSGRHSEEGQGR